MKLFFEIEQERYAIDTLRPIDISIPLDFHGEQPSAFSAPPAESFPYRAGEFCGDVAQGGSVNCFVLKLTPHCNGTHTETIGHILKNPPAIHTTLHNSFFFGTLITVQPEAAEKCGEAYQPTPLKGDFCITAALLRSVLSEGIIPKSVSRSDRALIVRTLPNDPEKKTRAWQNAPYFTIDAIRVVLEYGFSHLLIDLPSLDKAEDGGRLSSHRAFWGLEPNQTCLEEAPAPRLTITEFIYVPDTVSDGNYLLQIEIPPFVSDAAPSRPRLYEMTRE